MTGESVTELLQRASTGDREAGQKLMERVYPDLHAMAKIHFRFENPANSLQPTALVNEVYLKLVAHHMADWKNRAHFFAVASRAMRQILTDHARRSSAEKRGGRAVHVPFADTIAIGRNQSVNILILEEALAALEKTRSRLAEVVVCRYFGDMTEEEIAEALSISTRTVRRDWELARAWLSEWLSK